MTKDELKSLKPGDRLIFINTLNEIFFIGASRNGEVICFENPAGTAYVTSIQNVSLPTGKKIIDESEE